MVGVQLSHKLLQVYLLKTMGKVSHISQGSLLYLWDQLINFRFLLGKFHQEQCKVHEG